MTFIKCLALHILILQIINVKTNGKSIKASKKITLTNTNET